MWPYLDPGDEREPSARQEGHELHIDPSLLAEILLEAAAVEVDVVVEH